MDASLGGFDQDRARDLYRTLNEKFASLPGVENASYSATVPFGMITTVRKACSARAPNPAEEQARHRRGGPYLQSVLQQHRRRLLSRPSDCRCCADAPLPKRKRHNRVDPPSPSSMKRWRRNSGRRATRSGNASSSPFGKMLPQRRCGEERRDSDAVNRSRSSASCPRRETACSRKSRCGAIYLPFARGFQSNVFFYVKFARARGER